MRVSFGLAAVLAVLVSWLSVGVDTQETSPSVNDLVTRLPSCALSCIVDAVSQSQCALTDLPCICTSPSIKAASQPCIESGCTVTEALSTQKLQANTCGLPVRNKAGLLRRVQWTCFGLAIAAVIFRFIAKLPVWKGQMLWWDDWSILACLLIYVGSNVLLHRMIDNGLGQDIWMLTPRQITNVQRLYFYSAFTYVLGMCCVKISILLLYVRVFPQESVPAWFTWTCRILIAALFATALSFCVSTAASCSPVTYNWTSWDGQHQGHCVNKQGQVFASAAVNIFFDLCVFLIPLPIVLPLRISLTRKLGACAVFLIGLFVTICSIIRLQYLVYWGASDNPTWDNTELAVWSSVEANWGIICACMPAFARPIKAAWVEVGRAVKQRSSARTAPGTTPPIEEESEATSPTGQDVTDLKGFDERQYPRPAPSYEDLELANHPATRQTSSSF